MIIKFNGSRKKVDKLVCLVTKEQKEIPSFYGVHDGIGEMWICTDSIDELIKILTKLKDNGDFIL